MPKTGKIAVFEQIYLLFKLILTTSCFITRDSKTPVCDQLDNYLMCLNTAQQYVPAVGSLYINNIVSSLTAMIKECQALRQEAELHICHACDWSMSEEECDRQPAQRCLANQVSF